MPQRLKLATAQPATGPTIAATLNHLSSLAHSAAASGADILLLPEAFLGGYPRGCTFGATAVGARTDRGREQFLSYWKECVDLGDTPRGDPEWVNWSALRATEQKVRRGDGTRENLEQVARDTGVFIVVGVVEKSGGSLYCSALYIDPQRGCIGKRRKVQPTGSERLIWATGSPETLKAVVAEIKGVRVVMGAVICWENYMPLLRYALYSQNVNLWLAPTADARDGWLSLMRTVGTEGRCFVVSSCMCVQKGQEAKWIDDQGGEESQDRHADATQGRSRDARRRKSIVTKTDDNHEITWPPASSPSPARRRSSVTIAEGPHELRLPIINSSAEQTPQTPKPARKGSDVEDKPSAPPPQGWSCRGGSCIIAPNGDVLTGPLWEEPDGMLIQEVDFEDCIRGRLDFDAGGSYSRNDSFELKVKGLSLDPPV